MNIRVLITSLLLVTAAPFAGCGGDEDSKDAKASGARAGGGKGGSSAKPSDSPAAAGAVANLPFGNTASVACGSKMCMPQGMGIASLLASPCCVDEEKEICGNSPITGGACAEPVPTDERCPEIDVMGFLKLPGCCADNRCGIDGSMFGMPGCVDLKVAEMQVPAMGFLEFPQSRTCDGILDPEETPAEADAGSADAGSGE